MASGRGRSGRVKVSVSQGDIDRAVKQDSSSCVVATAVARTIPEAVRIQVDTQTIRYTNALTGKRYAFLTPLKVQAYVVAFDAGDPIPTFSFQLDNPIPVRQRSLTDEGKRRMVIDTQERRGKKPKRKKAPPVIITDPAPDPDPTGSTGPVEPVTGGAWRNAANLDDWQAPPLVFKRKHRTYGMRALRINQQLGRSDDATVPDEG